MLHAKQVTNPEGDLNTYFLYYSTTLIATTSIKTGKYASQQYEITLVHTDAFVNLPSSLIGEKPKIVEAESQTTGFEDVLDWNLQRQVGLHPNKLKNVAREAIKRALRDPEKEYIVMNVMAACADKAMKAEIHQDYLDALKNKQVEYQKPVADEPVGPSLDKESLVKLPNLAPSINSITEFNSAPDELVGPSLDNELPSLINKLPSLDDELPSLDDELPSLDDELLSLDDELPSLDDELPPLELDSPNDDVSLSFYVPPADNNDDELLSLEVKLPQSDDQLNQKNKISSFNTNIGMFPSPKSKKAKEAPLLTEESIKEQIQNVLN